MHSTDKQQLRKFGLLVGGIFLGLSLVAICKRGDFFVHWATVLGTSLILLAAIAPISLHYPHQAWMKIGHVLGRINSTIILTVIFYLLLTPMGLIKRLVKKDDAFSFKTGASTYWIAREAADPKLHMKRPF